MSRIVCCIAPYHPDAGFLSASLASPAPAGGRRPIPVDFVARFCGLPGPMLFARIRTVHVPMNITPIRIASRPAEKLDNQIRVRVTKSVSRPVARRPCRRGSMRARAGPVC